MKLDATIIEQNTTSSIEYVVNVPLDLQAESVIENDENGFFERQDRDPPEIIDFVKINEALNTIKRYMTISNNNEELGVMGKIHMNNFDNLEKFINVMPRLNFLTRILFEILYRINTLIATDF